MGDVILIQEKDYVAGRRSINVSSLFAAFLGHPQIVTAPSHLQMIKQRTTPPKKDIIWGDDVTQFSPDGFVWTEPSAVSPPLILFDRIASSKRLAVRLATAKMTDKFHTAQQNKTVLTFVELTISEATQFYIESVHGKHFDKPKDPRGLESVRLDKCLVVRIIRHVTPLKVYSLEVHLTAESAKVLRARNGVRCPSYACGSQWL